MPMGELRPSENFEDWRTGPVGTILNRLFGGLGSFSQGWYQPPSGTPIPPIQESFRRARGKYMESPLPPEEVDPSGNWSGDLPVASLDRQKMQAGMGYGSVAQSGKRPLTDRVPPEAQAILDRMLVKDTLEAIRRQNEGLPQLPFATRRIEIGGQ